MDSRGQSWIPGSSKGEPTLGGESGLFQGFVDFVGLIWITDCYTQMEKSKSYVPAKTDPDSAAIFKLHVQRQYDEQQEYTNNADVQTIK